jgi:hypothetical protein
LGKKTLSLPRSEQPLRLRETAGQRYGRVRTT